MIAGTYDLTARACADRPDFESQMLAIAWAAVAVALGEIADAFDVESEDLEERAA